MGITLASSCVEKFLKYVHLLIDFSDWQLLFEFEFMHLDESMRAIKTGADCFFCSLFLYDISLPLPFFWSRILNTNMEVQNKILVPWLVFQHGKHEWSRTFFHMATGSYHVRSIKEMVKKDERCLVIFSWLVVAKIPAW